MSGILGMHHTETARPPAARDRVWQSMRIMRLFSAADLAATAEAGAENAQKYCRGLLRSGVLRIAQDKRQGRKFGHTVYQLARDLGPLAPRLRSDGTTYDPNAHAVLQGGVCQPIECKRKGIAS
ncbi:hypothetical protein THICB3320732 [Thiomonas sp. CB3]|nr:hypothetical protein THICB3320732 [Thiomonas sp. CB3]